MVRTWANELLVKINLGIKKEKKRITTNNH